MASYAQVSQGSSGDTVKELQKKLNSKGYSLSEDGIFGAKTLAAVKDYQSKNSLQVDGIVGNKTWNSLLSGSNTNTQTTQQPAPATQPEKSYRYDADNDPVYQAAKQKVKDLEAAGKPVLQGTYDEQVKTLFDEIMGQKEFTYDLNGDALWQQYKDQYTTQGKMAMMDTMGQAAALTGGYGSSYGQGVGQQAYQGYLQQLNDRVPELYQLALQKYNDDQALLQEKYAAARELRADEYGRYRDETSDYYTDLGLAKDDENTLWNRGNSTWLTEQELRTQDEQTAYNRKQDEYNKLVTMIAGTGYTPTAAELEAAGMPQGQATALAMQYDKDQAAAAATRRTGVGGTDETEQVLNYKALGYDSYTQMTESLGGYAKTNGNSALWSKLSEYVSMGYMDLETAQNFYYQYAVDKEMSGSVEQTTEIPESIRTQAATYKNFNDLMTYLQKQIGKITETQMAKLYGELATDLTSRSWSVEDDGGINWFGIGIDADAKVKDEHGRIYTLKELRKELQHYNKMSYDEATDWIVALQKRLGI